MNEVIVAPERLPTQVELAQMSTQQLRVRLAQALTLSAQTLAYLAALWRELEGRGEDLSDLRVGLAAYLPMIAAGQLDANLVVRFAGTPSVLKLLATQPIADQQRLAAGGVVRVLRPADDGGYEAAEVPATAMTPAQARLAFDYGKPRSEEEQKQVLETAKLAALKRSKPGPAARVRYDAKADKIRIGSAAASVGEVMGAVLASASTPDPEADLSSATVIKLSEVEHKMLKIRAAQAGQTLQDYARAMLVMQNLM